jgi:uncharacterized membrane protein YdjX (TVP38/TMEM64 family)
MSSLVLGGVIAFAIARRVGAGSAERLIGAHADRWSAWVREHGIAFVAAIAIGALPKTVAYVALGGALHDPLSLRGMVAAALYLATSVAGVLLARRGLLGAGALRRPGTLTPQPS